APLDLGLKPRPASVTVLPGQRQLRGREGRPGGDGPQPAEGVLFAIGCSSLKLSGLAAKLIQVGAVGQLPHDVSSFRLRSATSPRKDTYEEPPAGGGRGEWTQSCPRTRRRLPARLLDHSDALHSAMRENQQRRAHRSGCCDPSLCPRDERVAGCAPPNPSGG